MKTWEEGDLHAQGGDSEDATRLSLCRSPRPLGPRQEGGIRGTPTPDLLSLNLHFNNTAGDSCAHHNQGALL